MAFIIRKAGEVMVSVRGRVTVLVLALTLALMVALLTLAGTAAAAVPSKPKCKAPAGPIVSVRPAFTWSRALRAKKYEVRVYFDTRGSQNLYLRKSGVTTRRYTWGRDFPLNKRLLWKVRGVNANGSGPWSDPCRFKIQMYLDPQLEGTWLWQSAVDGNIVEGRSFKFLGGYYWYARDSLLPDLLGRFEESGRWYLADASVPAITFIERVQTWTPAEGDQSGIAAYANVPQPMVVYPSYSFNRTDFEMQFVVTDDSGMTRTYHKIDWQGF